MPLSNPLERIVQTREGNKLMMILLASALRMKFSIASCFRFLYLVLEFSMGYVRWITKERFPLADFVSCRTRRPEAVHCTLNSSTHNSSLIIEGVPAMLSVRDSCSRNTGMPYVFIRPAARIRTVFSGTFLVLLTLQSFATPPKNDEQGRKEQHERLASNEPISVRGGEVIYVQPVARLTWHQIIEIDRVLSKVGEPPRAIHPPGELPGPREVGLPEPIGSIKPVPEMGGLTHHGTTARRDKTLLDSPPTLTFNALDDNNTVIPPDTHGAIGPSHAMTMLNSQVRIQDKTGTIISTVTLSSFWSSISGSKFDPKVLYDPLSSRWMAVCDANANLATSKVCFAISSSSDPTGSWTFYEFDADASNTTWADYPGFGLNGTWIAITHNMFTVSGSPSFVGAKMWVIDKSTALAGGSLTTTVFPTSFDLVGGAYGATLQPCQAFVGDTLFIVDNTGFGASGTFMIRISRITGTASAPTWSVLPGGPYPGSGLFFVANNFNYSQIDADQLGTATDIETNDPRMLNAVYRNGRIWCTHSGGLPVSPSTSNRTAVFWYQLDPLASSPIVQSGVLDGGVGVHHYFPSITANSVNDALIGFTRSDAAMYAQAVFTGRLSSHPPGSMLPIDVIKLGLSSYSKFFGGSSNRWGDYSASVVDPSDGITFWSIQEYAAMNVGTGTDDGRWGTYWAKVDPSSVLPIQLAYFTGIATLSGGVQLRWGTLSEVNNFGFEVQKRRAQFESFETIANSFVPGHGTTLEPQHYEFLDVNASAGTWYYRLKQIDLDGSVRYLEPIQVDVLTDVAEQNGATPSVYTLQQNYPNPFGDGIASGHSSTTIRFSLPTPTFVKIDLYDLLGRHVGTIVEGVRTTGEHAVKLNANDFAAGTYIYRMQAGEFVATRKLVLMR